MQDYDLVVVGGGINGAGIARDAAGRGLSVLLLEKGDLSGATSSWSSKLIHGGLRYLEYYDFRLVAEALAEREVLLKIAGHLVSPLRFVMPHVPELRPRWMIRAGLFLYDHLGRHTTLPRSQAVRLDRTRYGAGLKPALRHGFLYSDCRVDDARLVLVNAMAARSLGAEIRTRTECVSARRGSGVWHVTLRSDESGTVEARARAIVNAAGPWVKHVRNDCLAQHSRDDIRLVRGSHLVMPRLYDAGHAYILQNDDRRVVFMIPFEQDYTLIGTTDVPHEGDPTHPEASAEEADYLCRAVNRYLARPVTPKQAVWRYAGVRPLYDDGSSDPSAITRDYTLRVDDLDGTAPVVSVYGGKITTYRRLAEHVLEKLEPYLSSMRTAWTSGTPLPGSNFGGRTRAQALEALSNRYRSLPRETLQGVLRRHGALAPEVLGDASSAADLGEDFGAGLCERELVYLQQREWAETSEDVLWRRTKCGLPMTEAQRARVAERIGR